MVSKKPDSLKKGDWIVHTYYGIGQIKSVETKSIGDEKTKYFKVIARNSEFFVPVGQIDTDRVRPVASDYKLRKAKKILKEEPNLFPDDHNDRKKLLNETTSDSSMEVSAQTIRDLRFRKKDHGLNDFETKILHNVEKLFIREWSIIQDISEEDALERFEKVMEEPEPIKK
ncbi:MAG: CarD family transcriptional regulator [Chloroflexota bacterium]